VRVVDEVDDTWRPVELAYARAAPYDELMSLIDNCAAKPRAQPADIESWRLLAALDYNQPHDVCDAALRRYMAVAPPSLSRSARVLGVCGQRERFADVYLDGVIDELERRPHSDATEALLESAYRLRHERDARVR
jgi:hypothetical protein